MKLTLREIALRLSGASIEGPEGDREVCRVRTDNREVTSGDLFFCLKGERFDGHDFAVQAAKAGACAIVADRALPELVGCPVLVVADTQKALGELARYWRDTVPAKVIAITGTAGKTTAKELLAQTLGSVIRVAKNHKNFNNQVGLPLSMNAGSYGVETADVLTRVRLWTPGGGLVWRAASACAFGYRHFDANLGPGFSLVWEAEFRLTQSDPDAVRAKMREVYAKKKSSQPVTARSAGCVFKNPLGHSAGRLLDEAGMRGKRLGGMAFSDVHANFLVNLGGGTAAQALELMEFGAHAVRARFGVELETEVVVLK